MRASQQQADARAFCEAWGIDPDEEVWGYWDTGMGKAEWISAPRWSWYLGVSPDPFRPLTDYEKAIIRNRR
jgi:hypothetical protein